MSGLLHQNLQEEFGVSARTIYRDIDTMSACWYSNLHAGRP
ncbi:MAG: HTH domain-containing protein [Enterocloster bolteae]